MLTSDPQSVSGRKKLNVCHPERSLAIREANRQTTSKDPYEFVRDPQDIRITLTSNFFSTNRTSGDILNSVLNRGTAPFLGGLTSRLSLSLRNPRRMVHHV
jgi:hypothetical protein